MKGSKIILKKFKIITTLLFVVIITFTSITQVYADAGEKLNMKVLVNGEDSKDFERKDIPANLNECYTKLDNILNNREKRKIKNTSKDDLIDYHFSLGLWIRNNWIRPSNSRIKNVFLEKGIKDPDTMSTEIIEGYHNYLSENYKSGIIDDIPSKVSMICFLLFFISTFIVIFFIRLKGEKI